MQKIIIHSFHGLDVISMCISLLETFKGVFTSVEMKYSLSENYGYKLNI